MRRACPATEPGLGLRSGWGATVADCALAASTPWWQASHGGPAGVLSLAGFVLAFAWAWASGRDDAPGDDVMAAAERERRIERCPGLRWTVGSTFDWRPPAPDAFRWAAWRPLGGGMAEYRAGFCSSRGAARAVARSHAS